MFYLDAAWNIQNGTYTLPSPNRPYHHYLRWPVIIPLSFVVRALGVSSITLALYSFSVHMGIAWALYSIFRRLRCTVSEALCATLAVVLVPFTILFPGIGSEPITTLFLLLSLFFILPKDTLEQINYKSVMLSGALGAVALSATLASVFALILPLVVLWFIERRSFSWSSISAFLRHVVFFSLGAVLCWLAMMGAEWLILGDPLIRIRSIFWWHLRGEEKTFSETLSMLLDPNNENFFLFGYILNLIRQETAWMLGCLLGISLFLRSLGKTQKGCYTLLLACVSTWLCYELISWPVLGKTYLRFMAMPLLLLTSLSALGYYRFVASLKSKGITGAGIFLFITFTILQVRANLLTLSDDLVTQYFQTPIVAVKQHFRERHPQLPLRDLAIYTDRDLVPGFVHYGLLVPVYSDYLFEGKHVGADLEAVMRSRARIKYYIARHHLTKEMKQAGFEEIPYQMSQSHQVRVPGLRHQHVFYKGPKVKKRKPLRDTGES